MQSPAQHDSEGLWLIISFTYIKISTQTALITIVTTSTSCSMSVQFSLYRTVSKLKNSGNIAGHLTFMFLPTDDISIQLFSTYSSGPEHYISQKYFLLKAARFLKQHVNHKNSFEVNVQHNTNYFMETQNNCRKCSKCNYLSCSSLG